jgi:Na+-transporting NADH:ubiquinone oxidoreductase subunit NqrB
MIPAVHIPSPSSSAPAEGRIQPHGRRFDPRWWQIFCLGGLLTYGLLRLHFDTPVIQVAATIGTAMLVQLAFTKLFRVPTFEWKSALISGFGLCFLFRANDWRLAVLCAFLAIGSKFLIRWNGKHIWNPTNFALVVMMLAFDRAWVSPGQWGSGPTLAYAMAMAGAFVVNRSARSDTSIAFIAAYAAILMGRSLWMGEPLTIPIHRLQNGALMIFTFHMISDPKTTPNTRAGRILFASLVAAGAGFVAFGLFRTNGPIWALAALAPLVPLIDRVLPGPRYEWKRPVVGPLWKGDVREQPMDPRARDRVGGAALGAGRA